MHSSPVFVVMHANVNTSSCTIVEVVNGGNWCMLVNSYFKYSEMMTDSCGNWKEFFWASLCG